MRQIAVIGLGRFGRAVAYSLVDHGVDVLAIDESAEVVQTIAQRVARAAALDATDRRALGHVGVQEMDAVVVGIGNDMEASIFTTGVLSELGVRHIVARATRPLHARILRKVGAHRVVYLENEMGENIAKSLMGDHVLHWFTVAEGLDVAHLAVGPPLSGKSLMDLHFRKSYGLMVVGHEKAGQTRVDETGEVDHVVRLPNPSEPLRDGDHIVVVGPEEAIMRLQAAIADGMH